MNFKLTDARKEVLARLMRRPPLNGLMAWGVRLFVPRQRVGVALVTFNAKEEVLLLRHVFHAANPWGLPGGWLGRNESPGDGVAREMREETGLGVVLGPPVYAAHENPPSHIIMAYLGWLLPGEMAFSAEIHEARWFALDRLPRPLWPFTETAIAAGLQQFRLIPGAVPPVTERIEVLETA